MSSWGDRDGSLGKGRAEQAPEDEHTFISKQKLSGWWGREASSEGTAHVQGTLVTQQFCKAGTGLNIKGVVELEGQMTSAEERALLERSAKASWREVSLLLLAEG